MNLQIYKTYRHLLYQKPPEDSENKITAEDKDIDGKKKPQ